jgi:hypothetical protein
MTEPPASITYSSIVSRGSVRLAFLLAALNNLDIMAYDIVNASLNAPCREGVWFVAGPEFGSRQGTVVKVVRALKSSGASWRSMFNTTIRDMGFEPTIANPDIYCKAFAKPDDFKYYECILGYADDALIISHQPTVQPPQNNTSNLRIEPGEYQTSDSLLGWRAADVEKVTRPGDPTGCEYCWPFSAYTYVVVNAVKNVASRRRPRTEQVNS